MLGLIGGRYYKIGLILFFTSPEMMAAGGMWLLGLYSVCSVTSADAGCPHSALPTIGRHRMPLYLTMWYKVLKEINALSEQFQGNYMDFSTAYQLIETAAATTFQDDCETAKEMAHELNVEPMFPVIHKRL